VTTKELLAKYIKFFEDKGHKKIPNVPLVPENDPTLLFVNSGMFPLVPYLSGEPHPLGKRLVNVQRCLRLADIEEIGGEAHTLVFHMLGNWGFADYFKKEQLNWFYDFLINELKIDVDKLYANVFEGDKDAPRDEESIKVIQEIFAKHGIDAKVGERIFPCSKKHSWWQRGDAIGELGGPDSETFYYFGEGTPPKGSVPSENDDMFVELGNSVFMQYKKTKNGWEELPQKNVDFGGGLERIARVVQGKKDIFETDNFWPIIEKIQELSAKKYAEDKKSMRILADHIRACTFLAMDGVEPTNKDQGYILRRLLRRLIRAGKTLGVKEGISASLVPVVVEEFKWLYPDLSRKEKNITKLFSKEETKFEKTLRSGSNQLSKIIERDKNKSVDEWAQIAFDLYQSLGYPSEVLLSDLEESGVSVDKSKFSKEFSSLVKAHQKTSRAGAEGKFKGGLADNSEIVIKYHTATHLLQAALKNVVGDHIEQIGSNITDKRLRFDFPNPTKLSEEEIKKVEEFIKEKIDQKLPVSFEMMNKNEAIEKGAHYMRNINYPDKVKVYYVGNSLEDAISKELCGGPHVKNTSDLQPLEIYKQENIGEGKLRLYARFV